MFKILSLVLIFLTLGLWIYVLWVANKELHSD